MFTGECPGTNVECLLPTRARGVVSGPNTNTNTNANANANMQEINIIK